MKVFVFDTETTWLFNKLEKNLDKKPYIIQFAWILVDMENDWLYNELERINIFIRPPISIPYETSKVHWLYDIDVLDKQPFEKQIESIIPYINNSDIIVWHNIEFDETMLKIEIDRLKQKWIWVDYNPKNIICTMKESIQYCRLPSKSWFWFKRPKLQELVKITLWDYFHWAHDAIVDVENTLKALSVLVEKWVIKLEKKETLTLF